MHQFQHQQILTEPPVANKLDVAGDLLDGVFVIASEVAGDAEQVAEQINRRNLLRPGCHNASITQPLEISYDGLRNQVKR